MKTYAPDETEIVTIERDPERAAKARVNFSRMREQCFTYGQKNGTGQISLLEGEAGSLLKEVAGPFDFIFMDAAKGQYIHFLPDILNLLIKGGLLLSDNIFKGGEILESRYAVKRRDRTIHKRMRQYLEALTTNEDLQTLLLQEGDGAALTLKL